MHLRRCIVLRRRIVAIGVVTLFMLGTILLLPAFGQMGSGEPFFKVTPSDQFLSPGDTTRIDVEIANEGRANATLFEVVLTIPTPLLLVGSDNKWLIDEVLEPGDGSRISLDIYAPPSSVGGTYQLTIFLTYYTGDPLNLKNDTRRIALSVREVPDIQFYVAVSDQTLEPDETKTVKLTIRNTGPLDANSLEITLTLPQPLAIVDKDNRWSFQSLEVGTEITITVPIHAPQSSQGLTYAATLKIDYKTPTGVSKSDSRTFSFIVKRVIDLNIAIEAIGQSLTVGEVNNITLTITNEGPYDTKKVGVTLNIPPPLTLVEKDNHWFFSSLGVGESVVINPRIYAPHNTQGLSFSLALTIDYETPAGVAKTLSRTVSLTVTYLAKEPALVVKVDKQIVTSGSDLTTRLMVVNEGRSEALSIDVSLAIPPPLLLVDRGSRWFISSLKPGENATISAFIRAPSGTPEATYTATLTFAYKKADGASKIETHEFNLRVVRAEETVFEVLFSPYSLIAGIVNNVTITLTNKGPGPVLSLNISLGMTQPLSLVGQANRWHMDRLEPDSSTRLQIQIQAPSGSVGVTVQPTLILSYKDALGNDKTDVRNIGLTVVTLADSGVRFSTSTSEYDLLATEVSDVVFTLENQGESSAQSLTVTLNLPTSLSVVGSDNQWYLPLLSPRERVNLSAKIFAPEAALGGSYQSTLSMKFKDVNGYDRTETLGLGLSVRGYIDIRITGVILRPDPALMQQTLIVSGIIMNGGIISAKTVNVTVVPQHPFKVKATESTIIGDIPKEGQASFSLSTYVEQTNPGQYPLNLLVTYKDDRNKLNSHSTNILVDVAQPPPSAQQPPSQGFIIPLVSNPFVAAAVAFIIGVLLMVFISRRRSRGSIQ